ncbi:hypothetical protein TSOC_003941 [Tetrabaena socialis]|uniref:Uncharacterized protein n=1 Tax=Tetrabaena socialis TaxID=47790 RepID=A0A2J8AA71_9CHLO|nr:hypothetical protein TSOC_003941 [Tetrabaena socialis]|eukprot:PNH09418.1 hypothetical protein TSOC_003941 [Tetrabaena socialis]
MGSGRALILGVEKFMYKHYRIAGVPMSLAPGDPTRHAIAAVYELRVEDVMSAGWLNIGGKMLVTVGPGVTLPAEVEHHFGDERPKPIRSMLRAYQWHPPRADILMPCQPPPRAALAEWDRQMCQRAADAARPLALARMAANREAAAAAARAEAERQAEKQAAAEAAAQKKAAEQARGRARLAAELAEAAAKKQARQAAQEQAATAANPGATIPTDPRLAARSAATPAANAAHPHVQEEGEKEEGEKEEEEEEGPVSRRMGSRSRSRSRGRSPVPDRPSAAWLDAHYGASGNGAAGNAAMHAAAAVAGGGAALRPLRMASHNMGGLRAQEPHAGACLEAAVQAWAELQLDVQSPPQQPQQQQPQQPQPAPPPPPPPAPLQQQPPPQQPLAQQPQPPAGPHICGLRLVPAATALGIRFANSAEPPQPDWQSTVTAAKQRMHRLTQTQLSAFGRCAGVSAYALQMNTYHWEHGGMPPGDEATLLEGWAAGVGDRRASPLAPSQRLTGIPRHLLHGHPTVGDFGLLPLTLHTRARNAVWAARLSCAAGQPADASHHPWTRIIALYHHPHHPLLSLSSVLTAAAPSTAAATEGGEPLPAEICRITAALGYLPPVQEVDTTPMPAPGDWCFNVPLWGNPLLPNAAAAAAAGAAAAADAATAAAAAAGAADPDFKPDDPQLAADAAAAALPRPGLDCRHTRLATCTALRTVGDAVRIGRAVSGAPLGGPEWQTWVAEQLAPRNASTFRRSTVTAAITGLLNDISAEWRDAAAAALDRAGGDGQAAAAALAGAGVESEAEMRAQCVNRVGWRLSPSLVIRPRKLTVGIATMLQHQVGAQQRARLHAAYEREARQQPPANPPMGGQPAEMQASCVPPVLQRLWGMQWEREHKETMWRLAIDAVPLPGNSHLRGMQPEQCGCGGYGGAGAQPCSPRAHHFWECPVAKAVVAQIAAHVPGPVSRAHVWLAEAPPGMQQGVWDAVALAALSAMERARVGLRAATRHAAGGAAAGGAAGAGVAPPPAVEVAKARAVLEFWQRLRGFAELGVPSRGWGEVGAEHPILSVEDGRMRCAPPAGLDLDSDP